MASIEITRAVRGKVEALLAERFNGTLATVCADYGCTPFIIDFDGPDKNYFRGPWTLDMLLTYKGPLFPCMTLHGVSSINTHREKPRTFSGNISIQGVVLLPVSPDDNDLESLPEAVEATLYELLEADDADFGNAVLDGSSISRLDPVWVGGATDDGTETVGGFIHGVRFELVFDYSV